MDLSELGLHVPTILLPGKDVALEQWAVIACDQYTSEPDYWNEVRAQVGAAASTLSLVFPEVYLESAEREKIIADINARMNEYLQDGVLQEQPPGFVLVERQLQRGKARKGLMVGLDLEHYDYRDGAQKLVRTTEGTVLERLPPRIQVRRQAALEVPHIMVLIDDPQRTVIEPLFNVERQPLYDSELMLGGGRVKGFHIGDEAELGQIAASLAALNRGEPPMLYAMGDGNHSFATAKAVWEQIKEEADDLSAVMQHPARYGLVELVNIHDEGLEFEPIHRAIFGVQTNELMEAMQRFFVGQGFIYNTGDGQEEQVACDSGHRISFISGGRRGYLAIEKPEFQLEVASLQAFINDFIEQNPLAKVDYIHGEATLEKLAAEPLCTGFFLPTTDKHNFFQAIMLDGALPRKTFSVGEAEDKRYYMECRRIAS
jgi:hypothetical protein